MPDTNHQTTPTKYDCLKLENQLCFPLYACSREVIRAYKPYLDELDLTYTQYITMMCLWETPQMTVKALGNMLFLDSGTLTPVLKKLENKGFIKRERSKEDERSLIVTLTPEGRALRDKAVSLPETMRACMSLDEQDAKALYTILHKWMASFKH